VAHIPRHGFEIPLGRALTEPVRQQDRLAWRAPGRGSHGFYSEQLPTSEVGWR
jgi:hypothetical protein